MHSVTARTGDERRIEQSSPEVRQVLPADARHVWPIVEPFIDRALRRGQGDESTPEHQLARIEAGLAQLWVVTSEDAVKAVVVLSIVETDAARKLNVDILAGSDMDTWEDYVERLLLEFMDITGAACIEASCRPGLAKRLKARGWRRKAVVMELT